MTKPNVDRRELIKIISIIADDMPKGMDILELYIQQVAVGYAQETFNEVRSSLTQVIKD